MPIKNYPEDKIGRMNRPNRGFNKNLPLWFQLSETIKAEFLDLDLPEDLRLPTEQQLCDRYGASIITVRQALKHLDDSDLISRFRRRGTFVNPEAIEHKETMYLTPSGYRLPSSKRTTKLIDKSPVEVPSSLKEFFTDDQKVTRIRRVRLEDGVPLSYGINHIPRNLTKGIIVKDLRAGTDVTELLRKKSRVKFGQIVDSFEAKPASPLVADFLDIQILAPVILFTTVHRDKKDNVVNVAWAYIRADKYMFSISRDAGVIS